MKIQNENIKTIEKYLGVSFLFETTTDLVFDVPAEKRHQYLKGNETALYLPIGKYLRLRNNKPHILDDAPKQAKPSPSSSTRRPPVRKAD